jgi:ParB/RepB/Spo0J family partition protein
MTTIAYKELTLEGADFLNPRIHIDGKAIKELAESIQQHGLLYSLCVWKTKNEAGDALNVVVDGGRRLRAIGELVKSKKAGDLKDKVPVRFVLAKSLKEARISALVGNIQRVELTSFEVAQEMLALKEEEGMEQKAIAAQLKKSPTWVSRQLKAMRSSTDLVKKAWRQGKISDDTVQDLCKLPDVEQNKRLQAILDHLENNKDANGKTTRDAKAAARAEAKGGDGDDGGKEKSSEPKEIKPVRPSTDKLERYIEVCSKAKKKDRYVTGMLHAFKFMNGDLGPGEFDKEWLEFAEKQGMYKSDAN